MFPWTASGRAIANGRDEGVTKLLFDDSPEADGHGNILGSGMVGTHAGDMIGEVALAIRCGNASDRTPHPVELFGGAQLSCHSATATAHTALVKGFRMLKARAILALGRLKFLSIGEITYPEVTWSLD